MDSLRKEKEEEEEEEENQEDQENQEKRPLLLEAHLNIVEAHPRRRISSSYRYTVLSFACLLSLGTYFSYDIPGALSPVLMRELRITSVQYNALYSVYSWPNTILVFYGGYLVDRMGTTWSSLLFSAICCMGQAVVSVGGTMQSYWLMVAGRFLFGLGGESLTVAQTSIVTQWFKDKELALAFGISLTVSRLGTILAWNVEPHIEEAYGLGSAMWLGTVLCGISVVSALVCGILNRRQEPHPLSWLEEEPSEIRLRDVTQFQGTFWILTFICMSFYAALLPFTSIASDYFHEKYGYTARIAGHMVSNVYNSSLVLAPLLGMLIDRIGLRAVLVTGASMVLVPSYFALTFSSWHPIGPMITIGLAYSMCTSSLWPSVPLVVRSKELGRALGLMQAFQNMGLAVTPLLVGSIRDSTNYHDAMILLSCIASVSLLLGILLNVLDLARGGTLNSSATRSKDEEDETFPHTNKAMHLPS